MLETNKTYGIIYTYDYVEYTITGEPYEFKWYNYVGAGLGGALGMLSGAAFGMNPIVGGAFTGGYTSILQDSLCNKFGDCNYSTGDMLTNAGIATVVGGLSGYIFGRLKTSIGLNSGTNSYSAIFKGVTTRAIKSGSSISFSTVLKGASSAIYEGLILDYYFGIKAANTNENNDLVFD